MAESRSLILSQMCAPKFSCFLMSDRLLGGRVAIQLIENMRDRLSNELGFKMTLLNKIVNDQVSC